MLGGKSQKLFHLDPPVDFDVEEYQSLLDKAVLLIYFG